MSSSKLRQSIINALIDHSECTITQLSLRTGFSRVSISAELSSLCDTGTVKKKNKSRAFKLQDNSAFIIYKLHEKDAEVVCVSSDKSLFERKTLSFLYSLSYEENVTFLSANVQKQCSVLKKKYERVFLCVVYDKEINLSRIISRQFEIRESRHSLTARYMALMFKEENVLYCDTYAGFSCLVLRGLSIGKPCFTHDPLSELLPAALSLFTPDRIFVEADNNDEIKNLLSNTSNVPLSVSGSVLRADEKQIIIECLCK